MPPNTLYLSNLLPLAGFYWPNHPRIMHTDKRDKLIVTTLSKLINHAQLRKRTVKHIFVNVFDALTSRMDSIRTRPLDSDDADKYEDVIAWLIRLREEAIQEVAEKGKSQKLALAAALPQGHWLEFVYRVVEAHEEWEEGVPPEMKAHYQNDYTRLYHSVRAFRDACEVYWERDRQMILATIDPTEVMREKCQADWASKDGLTWLGWALSQEGDEEDDEQPIDGTSAGKDSDSAAEFAALMDKFDAEYIEGESPGAGGCSAHS